MKMEVLSILCKQQALRLIQENITVLQFLFFQALMMERKQSQGPSRSKEDGVRESCSLLLRDKI